MLIPGLSKEAEFLVKCGQKQNVKKPDVADIVNIEAIMKLKHGKAICPCCTNLGSNINPELFNLNIVTTPVLDLTY